MKKNILDNCYDKLGIIKSKRPLTGTMLKKLKESMYTDIVYNSNAIEGNTLTLSETALVIEKGITVSGKPLKDHLEAKNLYTAMEYIEGVAKKKLKITESLIKTIQKMVTVGTLEQKYCGKYRNRNITLRTTTYIPSDYRELSQLMSELLEWYNKRNSMYEDKLETIFIFHQKFVHIHPFADGNGRTVRILTNLMLMQLGYPPISVQSRLRTKYFDAIDSANWDESNTQPIIDFLASCLDSTLDKYIKILE